MTGDAAARGPSLADHYAHCEVHVRSGDRDTWLATLFAPADKRPHLHALHAFLLEIVSVRERVTEAMAGELRLQWWRDAIEGEARGEVGANPVAAAMLDTVKSCRLPRDLLTDLIEAHRFDLYDDPMPTLHDWESYCEQTAAIPIRLASVILTGRGEPGGVSAASHAGVALSVRRQLLGLSVDRTPVFLPADLLARHKLTPADIEAGVSTPPVAAALTDLRGIARLHLDALRRHLPKVEEAALPAYLTTALVEPTLRLAERAGTDLFRAPPAAAALAPAVADLARQPHPGTRRVIVRTLGDLAALYDGPVAPASVAKVTDRLTAHYRALVEASPFAVLATCGPEGLDCSPRGDRLGFVRIADDRTLLLPDRRGNNRIDSLRNIVRDPRVALLFLIPGSGTTFRVNGRAVVSAEPALLASFAVDGKAPRTVTVVTVGEAYFQCARAIVRARLWDPTARVDPASLPTAGAMLDDLSAGGIDGQAYDATWPERAAKTLW